MRLFLWFSTNVSLLGFVSSIVTIIRKPVGHENECSSRKERSISFTVMASFFGTTATVCKWTVEAVLWLLLCFFFTVGPSDWIALLFYMTQREKQYDRHCCWGCIMDYGQSKNNNWFHMHSSCSHAISYITSVDQNTQKIELRKLFWDCERSEQRFSKICILLQKIAFWAFFDNCKIENGFLKQFGLCSNSFSKL